LAIGIWENMLTLSVNIIATLILSLEVWLAAGAKQDELPGYLSGGVVLGFGLTVIL
jgi:hypothetical protein